jgi:hypothetical protein
VTGKDDATLFLSVLRNRAFQPTHNVIARQCRGTRRIIEIQLHQRITCDLVRRPVRLLTVDATVRRCLAARALQTALDLQQAFETNVAHYLIDLFFLFDERINSNKNVANKNTVFISTQLSEKIKVRKQKSIKQ